MIIKEKKLEIGTKVILVSLPDSILSAVPEDEIISLKSMIGETLEVYEIDEWGGIWVEKVFEDETENRTRSHSLKVEPHQIKII